MTDTVHATQVSALRGDLGPRLGHLARSLTVTTP
ncbi:MAG: hypothetical protein JWR20_1502 [Marmoricola sp.]|nr:hypothetical protein [Marmoricola sp.]